MLYTVVDCGLFWLCYQLWWTYVWFLVKKALPNLEVSPFSRSSLAWFSEVPKILRHQKCLHHKITRIRASDSSVCARDSFFLALGTVFTVLDGCCAYYGELNEQMFYGIEGALFSFYYWHLWVLHAPTFFLLNVIYARWRVPSRPLDYGIDNFEIVEWDCFERRDYTLTKLFLEPTIYRMENWKPKYYCYCILGRDPFGALT